MQRIRTRSRTKPTVLADKFGAARGARGHSVLNPQGPYDRSLSNHGLGKGHHGAQVSVVLRSYGRVGRARLLELAMQNRLLDHYRHQTIASARGLVLEVGVGSGVNLPLYRPAVTHVVGLDPSPQLLRLASRRAADAVVPVSLLRGSAEHDPFADAVFDTIVMTWTLCSIPNPIAALTEMRRVLRPGGRLIFVEHGLSPEIRTAR